MQIEFKYSDGDEESINLTEEKAKKELLKFLNRFSDCGKRQWMSGVKNRDYPPPTQDDHYEWVAKIIENE